MAKAALSFLLSFIKKTPHTDVRIDRTRLEVMQELIKCFDETRFSFATKKLCSECIQGYLAADLANGGLFDQMLEFTFKKIEEAPSCGVIFIVKALIESKSSFSDKISQLIQFTPFICQYSHDGVISINELFESFGQNQDQTTLKLIIERYKSFPPIYSTPLLFD